MMFGYLVVLTMLLSTCDEICCWAFEYETTQFTSAIFNYSYTRGGKRYVASDEAVKYYTGRWGSLNPANSNLKSIVGHAFCPILPPLGDNGGGEGGGSGWELEPFFGCSYEGVDIPEEENDYNDLMVIVRKGGECTLWEKLQLAAKMNFSALIEYDPDKSIDMEELADYAKDAEYGESPVVYALAVYAFGSFIEELYHNGSHPHLTLSQGQTTIMRIGINKTSVLFVATSFVVLTLISLAWLLFYYIQRFRYLHNRDRTKKRLAAAAKKALTILQVKVLKKGVHDISEDDNCCSICIDDFQYGEAIRELPCAHKFHRVCVDPWLITHYSCPNCKINVLKALDLIDRVNVEEGDEDDANTVNSSGDTGSNPALNDSFEHPNDHGGNGGIEMREAYLTSGARMNLVLSITAARAKSAIAAAAAVSGGNEELPLDPMIPSTSSSPIAIATTSLTSLSASSSTSDANNSSVIIKDNRSNDKNSDRHFSYDNVLDQEESETIQDVNCSNKEVVNDDHQDIVPGTDSGEMRNSSNMQEPVDANDIIFESGSMTSSRGKRRKNRKLGLRHDSGKDSDGDNRSNEFKEVSEESFENSGEDSPIAKESEPEMAKQESELAENDSSEISKGESIDTIDDGVDHNTARGNDNAAEENLSPEPVLPDNEQTDENFLDRPDSEKPLSAE